MAEAQSTPSVRIDLEDPRIFESVKTGLANLDEPEFFLLMEEVTRLRRERDAVDDGVEPGPDMTRDDYARWVARTHLRIDPGLKQVIYLPTDAPADEVRLIEVNALFSYPKPAGPLEALDFSDRKRPPAFSVYVVDVSTDQWAAIRGGSPGPTLPEGWILDGCRVFDRGQSAA